VKLKVGYFSHFISKIVAMLTIGKKSIFYKIFHLFGIFQNLLLGGRGKQFHFLFIIRVTLCMKNKC